MNQQNNREPRRHYRLNTKKLLSTLMSLVAIGVIVGITIFALSRLGIITASAQTSDPIQSAGTSHGAAAAASGVSATRVAPAKSPKDILILIDPGHGGFDPGAMGSSGVQEDDLNLAVAECLKAEFEAQGMQVVLTREDENAIAEDKDADMAERRRIIEDSGSDIVVSVHMNNYPDDPDVCGPLVLFMPGSEQGKALAEAIQASVNEALGAGGSARSEDLYVLRSGNQPCALIECGYLSNSAEELKLQQSEYQQHLAQAICEGVMAYFGLKA